jgi:FKBP-type peptidyl-prolyl cis-trans isomerase FklB
MLTRIALTLALALFVMGCEKPTAPAPGTNPPAAKAGTNAVSSGVSLNEWKTTASGLRYMVLKRGTNSASPAVTNLVRARYHGTLLDGTVFDSSVQRGEPATFPVNRVVPGWTEGLQLMKVGDTFKFEIPANLAYGPASPPGIPPNSALVLEVELLEIQ